MSSLNACSTEQHHTPDKDDFLIACLGPLFDAFVPIALPHHTASRNRPQKERIQVLARRHDGRGIRTSKITNHRSAMPHAALRTSHEVQCQCTSWLCHHKQQLLRELHIRSPQHTEEAFQASTRHCMEAEHLARLKWSGRCALRIVDRQSGHGMCANILENAMDGLAEDIKIIFRQYLSSTCYLQTWRAWSGTDSSSMLWMLYHGHNPAEPRALGLHSMNRQPCSGA